MLLWKHALLLCLLVAAGVIAYCNNFTAEFVYDDYPFIVENAAVRSLSDPLRFFVDRESFSDKGQYVIYRPLASLSFAANYAMSGYNPAAFHAVNIILHAFCGLLIYLFFYSVFEHAIFAFFVALLFLVHPVQTEAVSWVSARGNSLFLAFFVLSLMCYRRWTITADRGWLYYGLALGAAVFSLMAKEMAVVLPALLLVFDFSLNRPKRAGEWRKRIVGIIPFAALSLLYVLVRHAVLGETRQMEYWGGSFGVSSLTMIKAFAYYMRLMFVPRPLMVEYVMPIARSFLQPVILVSAGSLLAAAVAWFLSLRRFPIIGFGILWFFAALLPVSNVVPLQAILNERFLYLSSIGFCAILASPVLLFGSGSKTALSKAAVIALSIISLFYVALTLDRNRDWRDSLSLWTASVEASPAGSTSRYNLGLELFRRGRYDEAVEHLRIACFFQEDFPSAHGLLGNVHLAKGDADSAIREYEIGLRQAPQDARFLHNLALAWCEKGKGQVERREMAQAVLSFQTALRYEPDFLPAKQSLEGLRNISEN